MKKFDLSGQTFGSLTVINRGDRLMWNCRCICGNTVICSTGNLRAKRSTTCKCSLRDRARERQTRHGAFHTAEHRTWMGMRNRCQNPANRSYNIYGGRNIRIDPRWDSFEAFLADMGPRPSPKHSIDRFPDNDGPYSPENCRWATRLEQGNNKRNNHVIEFNNKTLNLSQWAREVGISEDTLERRINLLKWSIEKALTEPVRCSARSTKTRPVNS